MKSQIQITRIWWIASSKLFRHCFIHFVIFFIWFIDKQSYNQRIIFTWLSINGNHILYIFINANKRTITACKILFVFEFLSICCMFVSVLIMYWLLISNNAEDCRAAWKETLLFVYKLLISLFSCLLTEISLLRVCINVMITSRKKFPCSLFFDDKS